MNFQGEADRPQSFIDQLSLQSRTAVLRVQVQNLLGIQNQLTGYEVFVVFELSAMDMDTWTFCS